MRAIERKKEERRERLLSFGALGQKSFSCERVCFKKYFFGFRCFDTIWFAGDNRDGW